MRITNQTGFSIELLREVIRFCLPPGVVGFDIGFKNSPRGWKGRAYVKGCAYHDRAWGRRNPGRFRRHVPYVTVGVPPGMFDTCRYDRPRVSEPVKGKGYLRMVLYSAVEDLVHLVAHELRHLWQAQVKKGHRVWGSRGQYSERDADAYALRMVRAWRRR